MIYPKTVNRATVILEKTMFCRLFLLRLILHQKKCKKIPKVNYFDLTKNPNIPTDMKLKAIAEIHIKNLGYNKSEFDVFIVTNDNLWMVYFIPKEIYDNNKMFRVRLDKTYKVSDFEEWNIKKKQ
jgi:hypothetical protein